MKIKVLIVEDEILVGEDVAGDLESNGFEVTGIALSANEAFQMIKNHPPHIILMDINIKGEIDGIDAAIQINKTANYPIIFVTSNTSSHFVNRAIESKPHAFISKPYGQSDLIIAIESAFRQYNELAIESTFADSVIDSIFVKSGDYYRKVMISDVIYIEADGSYCNVHTIDAKYTLSFNLNHFQNGVQAPQLKRVHRSFVVNLTHVDGLDKSSLLIGKKIIPVSAKYKDLVFSFFNKL